MEPVKRVAVVLSRNIRPYVEAAEGLTGVLAEKEGAEARLFFLEGSGGAGAAGLAERLAAGGFDLWAAVGPDSAAFIWNDLPGGAADRLYCMVLNPEKTLPASRDPCGISMNIPVDRQLDVISAGLPRVRRVGVLYDPAHNGKFVRKAIEQAAARNLRVLPLAVSSRSGISEALRRHWGEMDALWLIPDRTVISESIVQFIIKEALLRNTPVVGYNRFFYDSGAALALIFSYRELGAQAGRLALEVLEGSPCRPEPPLFRAWLNEKVFARIGMDPPGGLPPSMEWGP